MILAVCEDCGVGEGKAERRRAGPVELAVRKDLRAFEIPAGRAVLAQNALLLARALDGRDPATSGVAAMAQLTRELRATMIALTGGIDDDDKAKALAEFVARLSTPELPPQVRDAQDPGPADARPARGGHLRSVGQTPDAPPAARRGRRSGDRS